MHETMHDNTTPTHGGIRILLLLLAVALSALSGAAVASVDAQDDEQDEQDEQTEIESQLGDLIIRDIELADDEETGEITVEWAGELSTTIYHSQLRQESEQFVLEQARLNPGEETVFQVDLIDTEPSLMWTDESLENQQMEVIRWTDTSSRQTTLFRAVIYGGSVALIATGLMAYRRKNTYGDVEVGWEK